MSAKNKRTKNRKRVVVVTTAADTVKAARRALYAAERENHVGVLRRVSSFEIPGKNPRKNRRAAKQQIRKEEW